MQPAASATPTATGTSMMPGSGMRNGSADRSSRMASAPKTATSPAARTAHTNRHDLASNGATNTGTSSTVANAPRRCTPTPICTSRASPSDRAVVTGTPTMAVQPALPVNEAAHGRLTSAAASAATNDPAASRPAVRSVPPQSSVATASTMPMPTSSSSTAGASMNASAATIATCANRRTVRRTVTGRSTSVSVSATAPCVSMPAARRSRCTNHGAAA